MLYRPKCNRTEVYLFQAPKKFSRILLAIKLFCFCFCFFSPNSAGGGGGAHPNFCIIFQKEHVHYFICIITWKLLRLRVPMRFQEKRISLRQGMRRTFILCCRVTFFFFFFLILFCHSLTNGAVCVIKGIFTAMHKQA